MEIESFLQKLGIFSQLPSKELSSLASKFTQDSFKKDLHIFTEGDTCDGLYIVYFGRVKIVKFSPSGKEIILELIGKGKMFGAVALLSGGVFPATAVSVVSDTKIVKLSKRYFKVFSDRHPEIIAELAKALGERLIAAHDSKKIIALEKVEVRLATLLLKLHDQLSPEEGGRILVTRKELSELAGTTVETTIRTLSRLKKDGFIDSSRGTISIKRIDEIRKIRDNS